ncbi:MAG: ABC transporter ATP-binding protein [Planctomycetes bacterium]|nr:ABC transporter ATP-binding protein [Planctomycetota bacterium]
MEIKFNQISKHYGSTVVLDNLSFTVNAGELVCFLGPSGCGKTTLLMLLTGLIAPDIGEIYLDGRLVSDSKVLLPPKERRIGMVFQTLALWPHMTVKENLGFVLGSGKDDNLISEYLKMMNIDRYADRYPSQISEGERQRLALVRALIIKPRILLMDEPMSNLDRPLKLKLIAEVKRLHKEFGTTTICVTHDQEEAQLLADRIAVMKQGRIIQMDTFENIRNRPADEFVESFFAPINVDKSK